MSGQVHHVMISGTFIELEDHWEAVSRSVLGEGMFPLDMRNDSALDEDLIDASISKVNAADAYVGMISYRYGHVPECPDRNPEGLSLTELEYRRAVERGIPRFIFVMDKSHEGVSWGEAQAETQVAIQKREAFTERVRKDRVFAQFHSVSDLEAKAAKSMSRIRRLLDGKTAPAASAGASLFARIPPPPLLYAHPPYLPGYAFRGRVKELSSIDDWAGSADPLMLFEAIGGMGKSMVTWRWLTEPSHLSGSQWAGRLWYSFYERGADMRDFCINALCYITREPPDLFSGLHSRELGEALLPLLRAGRWLLVLDGLERVLAEYHRSDAAQLPDEEVGRSPGLAGRPANACIRPDDDELLQSLCTASPSKILISSRLMPRALLNQAGLPLPGVRRVQLTGLDPRDAELMLRDAGVTGDSERMQRYLEEKFACHPLVVGVVAGLVRKYMKAPNEFDRWVEDPLGGAAVNLADPDIRQRQNHILKLAFEGLDPLQSELITRIAIVSNSIDWEILDALNPARPAPPDDVRRPGPFNLKDDAEYYQLASAHAEAQPSEKKKFVQRMARYEKKARAAHHAAETAYKEYEQELAQWQRSPEMREAGVKLNQALEELEVRGLLQCDRSAGSFDLHPVVRGYAVQMLTAEGRERSGQKVADYFASRNKAPTHDAQSWGELTDVVQVVRALSLAGNLNRSWQTLSSGLGSALERLDLAYEYLELARALFPDGWEAPPASIPEQIEISNGTASRLHNLGLFEEANAQWRFIIAASLQNGQSFQMMDGLVGYAWTLGHQKRIYAADKVMGLALDVAQLSFPRVGAFVRCHAAHLLANRGEFKTARTQLAKVPHPARKDTLYLRTRIRLGHYAGWLRQSEMEAAIEESRNTGVKWLERELTREAGYYYLDKGKPQRALDAFSAAIEMARRARRVNVQETVWRGVALARLGRRDEAGAIAASIEEGADLGLAALHTELGNIDRARAYALSAYRESWCDGPPYALEWTLRHCRNLFALLGEAEPQLPPFDEVHADTIPFAEEVRAFVRDQKRRQRLSAKASRNGQPEILRRARHTRSAKGFRDGQS